MGYTYDHNGNRLTQSSSGTVVQSFTYNSHDVLTNGTAGSETDGYDLNGNETSVTINGETYSFVWDDEDRLTSLAVPGVGTNTFTYNGLGLRVGKTDSTGTYSYVCDGTSPGSPVLSDGHATYTPGLSENRGGTSAYYSNDRIGNLWTLDGASKNQLSYEDDSGFGGVVAGGNPGTPFGFGGANGCQTDADTGLVLMGHRYYDSRIGRFISQDPAGAGSNWYAYAGNNPTNKVDPTGLTPSVSIEGSSPLGSPGSLDIGGGTLARGDYEQNFSSLLSGALSRQDFAPIVSECSWDWGEAPSAAGDAAHLVSLYLPDGTLKTTAELMGEGAAILGASKYSLAAITEGGELLGQGWNVFATVQLSGKLIPIGAGMMGDGVGSLVLGAGSAAVAVAGTAYLGYQIGTGISQYQISPGYTVNDALSNKASGLGNWLQQNTNFGH